MRNNKHSKDTHLRRKPLTKSKHTKFLELYGCGCSRCSKYLISTLFKKIVRKKTNRARREQDKVAE